MHAERICVFARVGDGQAAIAAAPRLVGPLIADDGVPVGAAVWGDTAVLLPQRLARRYRNAYTGERIEAEDGAIAVAQLLTVFPVALLMEAD